MASGSTVEQQQMETPTPVPVAMVRREMVEQRVAASPEKEEPVHHPASLVPQCFTVVVAAVVPMKFTPQFVERVAVVVPVAVEEVTSRVVLVRMTNAPAVTVLTDSAEVEEVEVRLATSPYPKVVMVVTALSSSAM